MNNALLIQQASGPHTFLLDLTVKDHSNYCRKHAFDYWPIYGSALTAEDAGRHAFWSKVALLRKAVDAGYEYIVWLDSDCYIADDTRDLRDACPDDGIGLVWHGKPTWPESPDCYDHFNCGAVYIGNGRNAWRLLEKWWKAPDDGHFWHDQHAFNRHAIRNFEIAYLRPAPVTMLGYEWNAVPFVEFACERPVVAAWHGYLTDIVGRLEAMQAFIQQNKMRVLIEGCSLPEACQKADYCVSVGNLDGAVLFFERARELGAEGVDFLREFANCQIQRRSWADAVPLLREALEIEPENGLLWRMLSGCYDFLGEHEENGRALFSALHYSENAPGVMLNQAFWNLRGGFWREGFEGLKWDFVQGGRKLRHPSPEWDGIDSVKTLWVWAEQGLGDTLMLARFVCDALPVMVYECYLDIGKIVLEVQPPLVTLLRAQNWPNLEVVEQTADKSIPWEFSDHIGMFTLPYALGVTPKTLSGETYLKAPDLPHWCERMAGDGFKVGFSWAGSQGHGNNVNRNLTAGFFEELVETPGTRWYSLQRDIVIPQEAKDGAPEVTWLGDEFADMADTAAALANLDLVITCDSAIAHLAGAMGIPCWTLLSKSSDWRWLLEREDTPWYPSMRLFRQVTLGDWEPVAAKVAAELERLAESGSALETLLHG